MSATKSELFMDCEIIQLARHKDRRGNLSVVEGNKDIPFDIKRVYYLYDVPGGEGRGGHAHKTLQQLIIAVSGSFNVVLDDGVEKQSFLLNKPYEGLLIQPGMWRTLKDFSSGAVALVLASEFFDEDEYIRNYTEFKRWRKR